MVHISDYLFNTDPYIYCKNNSSERQIFVPGLQCDACLQTCCIESITCHLIAIDRYGTIGVNHLAIIPPMHAHTKQQNRRQLIAVIRTAIKHFFMMKWLIK